MLARSWCRQRISPSKHRYGRRFNIVGFPYSGSPLKEFGKMLPRINLQESTIGQDINVNNNKRADGEETKILDRVKGSNPKILEKAGNNRYNSGQYFVHRILGYRGVIVACKEAQLRNVSENTIAAKNYYLTFPDEDSNRLGYRLESYVNEDDIIPYRPTIPHKIQHENFDHFFERGSNAEAKNPYFRPKDSLHDLKNTYQNKLNFSQVYRQITNSIQVTVLPVFVGNLDVSQYSWYYQITLENLGVEKTQLDWREWSITDENERVHNLVFPPIKTSSGLLIGSVPQLDPPERPGFEYSSHIPIETRGGQMNGRYLFKKENDAIFEVTIPPFRFEPCFIK